ncbi:MAG: hypothetical protein ACLPWS_03875 [Rhodomicrobium sp.]
MAAASPLTAAGGHNPLQDLLFSPRVAFIWDHTRRAVTWMNAAARSKFNLGPQDLQSLLPAALVRRFAQCFDGAPGNVKACRIVKLKIARHPALDCALDVLELAGGNRGLIVAEADALQAAAGMVCLPAPARKAGAKAAAKTRPAVKPPKKPSKSAAPAPQLTLEELRSLKAIGRTVRRLAQEKLRDGAASAQTPACARPAPQAHAEFSVQTSPTLLFSAFDLVLFLGENLDIVGSEGRPQRLGHRKPDLLGKPAAQIFHPAEQAIFHRMARKLDASAAHTARDTLLLCDAAGCTLPCRAILGRWLDGDTRYFLALLSLAMPQRLKRLQPQMFNAPSITRMAA